MDPTRVNDYCFILSRLLELDLIYILFQLNHPSEDSRLHDESQGEQREEGHQGERQPETGQPISPHQEA